MISYAGVSLPVQTAEAAALIERYISVRDLKPFRPDIMVRDSVSWSVQGGNYPGRKVKSGSLYWPKGASRWAVGYFLVDEDSLNSIRDNITEGEPADLVMDDSNGGTATASLYMLPPHPLLGVLGDSSLWLLILVDTRYFWWFPDTGTQNITFQGKQTWGQLYTNVWNYQRRIPYINYDTYAAAYNVALPAPQLSAIPTRIPPYLDSIAYNIGQDIVVGLDGKVYSYSRSTSQEILNSNLALDSSPLAGGSLDLSGSDAADTAGVLPESIEVTFQQLKVPTTGTSGVLVSPTTFSIVSAAYSSLGLPDAPTSLQTRTFRGIDYATYNPAGTWTNQTALQSLVNQFAKDWYTSQTAPIDAVYSGIVPWEPEGLSDSIEWIYREDMVCTRIQRPAFNDPVEELYHTTYSGQLVNLPYWAELETGGTTTPASITGLSGTVYNNMYTTALSTPNAWVGYPLGGLPPQPSGDGTGPLSTLAVMVVDLDQTNGNPIGIITSAPRASENNWGIVTTTQQVFGGAKIFESIGIQPYTLNGNATFVMSGNGSTGLNVNICDNSSPQNVLGGTTLSKDATTSTVTFLVFGNSSNTAYFAVGNNTGVTPGLYYTDPLTGNVYSGGILTTGGNVGVIDGGTW